MQIFENPETIKTDGPTVLVLGKFDGLHLGHKKLIKKAAEIKKELGPEYRVCVFLLRFSSDTDLILPEKTRQEKLRKFGADYLVYCDFTPELRKMSAERFLSEIIIGRLGAQAIVAGPDLSFGYRGAGNAEFLKNKEEEYGFKLYLIEKEEYKGEQISSSRIRACISRGDYSDAAAMLGSGEDGLR